MATFAADGLANAKPYAWVYADATARTADTGFTPADVGKLAYQQSDGTYWSLTDDSPITWTPSAGGTGDMLSTNNLSDVANVATARTNLGLGTAAVKNVPASGNAASGEAVLGSDTRLTDSRTPTAHAASHQSGGSDAFTGIVPASAFAPVGLTGATAASRYVGATASGAPASGTFAVGDFVIDQTGKAWVCTTAGSPGTWTQIAGGGGGGATISSGAFASRPAAGNAGDLYLPTDGALIYEDTGSAWRAFGPVLPFTSPPPAVSSLTWVNQGTATTDETKGGILLTGPTTSTNSLRLLVKAKAAAPCTLTVGGVYSIYSTAAPGAAVNSAGVVLRESSTGKIISYGLAMNSGGGYDVFSSVRWTDATTFSAGNGSGILPPDDNYPFLRLTDDGTNHIWSASKNGQTWIPLLTIGRTAFLANGGDQWGIYVNAGSNTTLASVWCLHWLES